MFSKLLKPVSGINVIQIHSNVTDRVLNRKRVPASLGDESIGRIAKNMLKGTNRDSRDVYITVVDSELNVSEKILL